ncbi:molybdopterin-dependent oxidoreductase [Candidatus Woesearchaeota archaeon]|nr:molybdopterin-dependent oxidoreductase [Candidatus Woesearchaeota archaeon]
MKRTLILLLLLTTLLFVVSCQSQQTIKTLNVVEVREYKGERLDSIHAFRENSIKGPQLINISNYELEIVGLVNNPTTYTYDEVINGFESYEKVVQLNCVEGWSAKILWRGILLRELLEQNDIKPEANTIILYAYDGYSTSFPLEYVTENDILMAYMMNNATIIPERGFPFQLVAETKWGYKWIKWITKIELSDDEDYEGFWESRGYSNTGDLDKRFIGN